MKLRSLLIIILAFTAAIGVCAPAIAPKDEFALGLNEFNAGNWQSAADHLSSAAAATPRDPVRRVTAGVALANVKRYDSAVEQFSAAAALTPDASLPRILLNATYADMGRSYSNRDAQGAVAGFRSRAAKGHRDSLEKLLADSLVTFPNNSIAYCLLGDLAQLRGDLASAKANYTRAAELSPKWPKPLFNLGIANLQAEPKAAELAFSRVVQMDPSNLRANLWLGDSYLRQNQIDKAIETYNKAAADPALAAEAFTRIGNAQMQAGNYQAATEQFSVAAQKAPQDPRPIAGRAQALEKMGKPKEAEQAYYDAAQVLTSNSGLQSSQAYIQNQIGEVQAKQGRYSDAASNFESAFQLNPTPANAEALTVAQMQAGSLNSNVAKYESVLKKDAGSVPAMQYLLSAYRITGNAAGAVDMARRLIKSDPANAHIYYAALGASYMFLGRTDEAVAAYSSALQAGNALTWPDTIRSAVSCQALPPLAANYKAAFTKKPDKRTGILLFDLQQALNDVKAMIATAETLVKVYPDDQSLWLRLGQARETAGEQDAATAAYLRAVSGPDLEAAALARSRLQALKDR